MKTKVSDPKKLSRQQKIMLSNSRAIGYLAGKTGGGNSRGIMTNRHTLNHNSGNRSFRGNG
jgi:hypothetical protein